MLNRSFAWTLAATCSACVTYSPAPADPAAVAATVRARSGGTLTRTQATALALRQNATLQALEARVRAAGAVTFPLELAGEWRSESDMLALMLDPVALLGQGARGASLRVADAAVATAADELATARWRVVGAVAEAFAVDAALRDAPTTVAVDLDAFAHAGLAAPVALARVRAATIRAAAEQVEVEAERARNRSALAELLGLAPDATLAFASDHEPLPTPPREQRALLRRPDVSLAAARFALADAEFAEAVAAQYPALMLGPELPLVGGSIAAMATLRLPLGAHGLAVAARERREAARAELTAQWLAVSRDASDTAIEADAAAAHEQAAHAAATASRDDLHSAQVALLVDADPDAFARLADAAAMAVRDDSEARAAAVVLARARVRAAVAAGWPLVGEDP